MGAKQFIDDIADEDSGEEEGNLKANREDHYYDPKVLQKKNQGLNLDEMAERFKQIEEEDEDDANLEGYASGDDKLLDEDLQLQTMLPSTRDPKLWQVRVKKNFEKTAVIALLNKSIDFARKGRPLSILSVTSSDSTEGYIFVEAFKEIHVKEACSNLHFIFNSHILLPTE